MSKGILLTLEAVIAILMILFIVVFVYKNPREVGTLRDIDLKLKAYNGLIALERSGDLRKAVIDNDASEIENDLNQFIPSHVTFRVVIYNTTQNSTIANTTNYPSIIDDQSYVLVVSYLIAGDVDTYMPRDVRVFMWGFD
jgi:hypothetical protein